MAECKHGLDKARCTECRTRPPGINSQVFMTKGGAAYHNSKDCQALLEGQVYAATLGMEIHEIRSVNWIRVEADRQACLVCCPRSQP